MNAPAQSESPRAALTAEGTAEKPEGSFDARTVGAAPEPGQAEQLSSSEAEETFRQVLSLQAATAELIIAASRLPRDGRTLASACAALAERAVYVATLIERKEGRCEGLRLVCSALETYQREVILEVVDV